MVALPSGFGDDLRLRASIMRFLTRFAIVLVGWNFLPPEEPPDANPAIVRRATRSEILSETGAPSRARPLFPAR
jgi:hypothetical protein